MTSHDDWPWGARKTVANKLFYFSTKAIQVSSISSLKVLDEFPFEFYDETFSVALTSDRRVYVPIVRICESLGLDTSSQIARIERDEVLADAMIKLALQVPYGDHALRMREINCLRLDRLPYWLGALDASRIPDEAKRRRVILFKREFADVAWAAFRAQILPADVRAELDASLKPQERAYFEKMEEAGELRQQMGEHGQRIERVERRLGELEARLVGVDFISAAQAKQYIDMVAILGDLLKKKGKGNHAIVHADVKRHFNVPSYQLLPAAKFPDVVKHLTRWYQQLVLPGTPLPEAFTRAEQPRLF